MTASCAGRECSKLFDLSLFNLLLIRLLVQHELIASLHPMNALKGERFPTRQSRDPHVCYTLLFNHLRRQIP